VRIVALLLAVTVAACSFIGARVPDHRGAGSHLDCPRASVRTDAVVATIGLGAAAIAIVGAVANRNAMGVASPLIFAVPAAAVAIPYGASALYGHHVQNKCHRLDDDPSYAFGGSERELRVRHEAWELAVQGAMAAERGDCATAIKLGGQIRALDEATFSGDYMHDDYVSACHAAAASVGDQ
jgi:hypothetical protein